VKNWERFQHYKDRRPPWIKYHVELLDDHELQLLTPETRLTYSLLLLVAARTDNNIPSDLEYISRQTALPATLLAGAVETLMNKGFLISSERKRAASTVLARRKQSAMPRREEKRREEEQDQGLFLAKEAEQPTLEPPAANGVQPPVVTDEDLPHVTREQVAREAREAITARFGRKDAA
jgi:hypothetical protein